MFCKKGVLRNSAKFTGMHLCQSLFFKKETLAHALTCEFCEISMNTFSYRTPPVAASKNYCTTSFSCLSIHSPARFLRKRSYWFQGTVGIVQRWIFFSRISFIWNVCITIEKFRFVLKTPTNRAFQLFENCILYWDSIY